MVEKNNNKKTNFFKQAFKSIKDLDKYEDFATEQPKQAFKYLFKLIFVFALIISIFYTYKTVASIIDIYSNIKDVIPEFSYANGELKVDGEQPIIISQLEEDLGKIIIDTNIQENATEKYEDEIKNNDVAVLVLKDKIIIKSDSATGQVVYDYKDIASSYNISEFTKQDATEYIEQINIVYIYLFICFTIFVYLFIVYFVSILIDVLVLAILAFIVSRISKIKLKFAPSFNIAVHSITLPALLNLIYIIVNLLTGFTIKHFQFMYTTISYIYVIVAVLMIKTDFITRQLELMKIAQEQEKIKEELEKQKEEKEKKKEEKKQEKEKKPKEKKKQKEDDGELEGGVNPSVIQENK